jgi:surfeit locus 1 family protein
MTGRRPRLLPTLITIAIVVICIGLGAWQLERLQWKRGLIAARQAAVAAPPVGPPRTLEQARGMEFRHVADEGTFLNDAELYLGATSPHGGAAGFEVFTPLREADGRIVFVNRGFVPSERKDPNTRRAGEPEGIVRVSGLLRVPPEKKPGWFLPDNRSDLNYWFWIDLGAMAKADRLDHVAPFYIDADATPNPGGWPQGGVTPLELPNNHLQYAITWFSLAAGMLVIYIVSLRQDRRTV